MQPLERLKQLARIGRIEAGAVVAHIAADGGVPARCRPELDRRVVPAGRELPGVVEQVLQGRTDKPAVRQGLDWFFDREADVPTRFAVLEFLGDPGRLRAEVNWLQVQLGPREARKLHQVIDQLRHLLTGGDDPLGIIAAFLAENPPVVFQQGPAVTAERPQRGTQVMGNRIDEALQALTRTLQAPAPEAGRLRPGWPRRRGCRHRCRSRTRRSRPGRWWYRGGARRAACPHPSAGAAGQ